MAGLAYPEIHYSKKIMHTQVMDSKVSPVTIAIEIE